jgi:hypothetical protein
VLVPKIINHYTMKYKLLLIVLFGFLTFSCTKDDSIAKKDEIIYNDITPDKEIQTVRFYKFQDHSICTANIPTPTDSSVYYDLDLNADKVTDFRINVAHSKYNSGYCGHCDRFTYNISIEGQSAGDSIANSISQYWAPRLFNESDTIDKKNTWIARAEILLLEGCALPFNANFDKGFIALRINNSYGYIHVEKLTNNGIRITEYGFNVTENNIIRCGQK